MLFGIEIPLEDVLNVARAISCSHDSLTFTYLGLPVERNLRKVKAWSEVINMFSKRLATWKSKLLSIGGRKIDGTFRETLAEGNEGALHLGPERAQVYSDLSPKDKDRYNADIQATNILLQGLPKDIYTLINHYTDAKYIWDNVKMLLEVDPLALMSNVSPQQYSSQSSTTPSSTHVPPGRQNRGQGNNPRGVGAAGNGGAQNRVGNANLGQARQIKCYNCNVLDEEQLLFLAGGHDTTVDEDVDESPDAVCEHHDAHEMHHDVQPNCIVDSNADYTSDSNMIMYDQYVKDNAEPVIQSNVSFVPNDAYMMIINDMHKQTAQSVSANEQNKVVNASLTAELATYKEQVELYERRAKFELTEREQNIEE
ncbi:hypothetical protein Tco_1252306 [Tanacetum coccineum]